MPNEEKTQRLVHTIYNAFKELCEMHGINHLTAFYIGGSFVFEDLDDLKNPKIKVFKRSNEDE